MNSYKKPPDIEQMDDDLAFLLQEVTKLIQEIEAMLAYSEDEEE